MVGLLPKPVAAKVIEKAGFDRLSALHFAIDIVRRGGTISIIGVYGGMVDPLPMLRLFDKQVQAAWGRRTSSAGSTPTPSCCDRPGACATAPSGRACPPR
jgi:threonine dehydrogenase-like Zn-dependent dehydrogenase